MRCDRVRDILMDYVAEELPEKISMQVREHLAACRLCQAELEMAYKASGMLTVLGHQEEPQGVIRIPAATAKRGVPGQLHARLQLLGALLLAMAVCIGGGSVLRSFNRMPPVARVEQPAHTGNKSATQVLPHPSEQQSVAVHTETALHPSVRAPEPRAWRQHKPYTAHKASRQTHRPDKPAVASNGAQPVQVIVEISPSSLLPTYELPEDAILMVSVKRVSGNAVVDDSYSYRYTEYDPESCASIECTASRHGDSVEIRLHGKPGVEIAKGELDNEMDVEIHSN